MNIIPISGGKDSQATAIWYANNVPDTYKVTLLFCDTGNEADETYHHISKILIPALPKHMHNFISAKNKRGETLLEQAVRKKRFPSTKARFCTSELKMEPMIDFILQQNEDVVIYDGRRRQESMARSVLNRHDEYFSDYLIPKTKGEKSKTLHKRKDVLQWLEKYQADVIRPILMWSTKDVFEYISINSHQRNPLYDLGFNRVGCFPCIMCSLGEIIRVAEHAPEKIDAIRIIENESKTTFFGPDKIPVRFCKNQIMNDKGKLVGAPTIDEVIEYAKNKRHDDGLFKGSCLNKYVSCE
jgi:3'-phosphoadenosine 5'-phosphosulfate sulfotransferase (PAPS reductase)/FAD synthetase